MKGAVVIKITSEREIISFKGNVVCHVRPWY